MPLYVPSVANLTKRVRETLNIAASATTAVVVSFDEPFPDTNYTVTATVESAIDELRVLNARSRAVGSVTVVVQNTDAINANVGTLHVVAIPDA